MRTAFVTFFEAYPPDSGAAIVSYSVARFMPGERLLVQVAGRTGREEPDPDLTVESLAIPADTPAAKLARMPARIRAIVDAISRFGAQAVVLEGASWALYHWLLLRALRRRLPGIRVYYHAHNVEFDLRRGRSGRFIAALTGWAEGRLLRGADRAFAVSAVDARRFKELYSVDTDLLPNGVDVDRFSAVTDEKVDAVRKRFGVGPRALLFMGLYAYRPNTQAVEFLINEVMPRLLQTHPDAQLIVTGGEVPHRHSWLKNPGMLPFDDMPAMIQACSVGTAPIFSGSGTRLKILECMAAGIPVVATPKGAEGLEVEDARSILLARDGEAFASQIRRLWSDPGLGESITRNALQVVRSRYDWPVCVRSLTACLDLPGGSRGRSPSSAEA